MTTFPVPAGVIVLTDFGGAPVDPQPTELDVDVAANGGYVGLYPGGSEQHINPPSAAVPGVPGRPVINITDLRAALLRQAATLNDKGQTLDAIYLMLKGVLENGNGI